MIDEVLRDRMTEAYSEGRYEEALELSRQVDRQHLEYFLENTDKQGLQSIMENEMTVKSY